MVVDTRIELVTPAMSMQCSTAELIDRSFFGTVLFELSLPDVKAASSLIVLSMRANTQTYRS